MAKYTMFNKSQLRGRFQFTYYGQAANLACWIAIVDSSGNPVAGPDGHGDATGAAGVAVINGQAVDVTAILQNNGSIPSGTYGLRAAVFLADFTVNLAEVAFPVGTIEVINQAVSTPTIIFSVT